MELKSLKIFGFKSFPDETKFEFEPGVTAIVGPNGCGKSNIVDAIRWTLGEQNVHSLRAGLTEQLIFNGSQTRQPLGMAEVSLTFSNPSHYAPPSLGGSDKVNLTFSEITITRKIFRSGESEYFINKAPCRLKDITEVFMDTGLGVNAYSVISQDQIDMILNAKPEERRYIFEEAAGITKYSKRKNEALRKLDLTKQNLLRVQDIIAELERQSNVLKRQVYKAKRYRGFNDELKSLQVTDAFYQYKGFQEEKSRIDKSIENFGKEKSDIDVVFKKEEETFRNLQDGLTKLETELEEKREEQLRLFAEIERGNSTIIVNEERIKNLTLKLAEEGVVKTKLNEEFSAISQQLKSHLKTIELAKKEEEALSIEAEEVSGKITEISDREKTNEKELEEKNSQLIELLSEQARLKNALENSKINAHNLEIRLKKLAEEKEGMVVLKLSLETELNTKKQELENSKKEAEEVEARIKSFEKSLIKIEEALKRVEDGIINVKSELQAKRTHLSALEEMHSKDEGMQSSVKFIMESEEKSHAYGLIFNTLQVSEEFQKAIEVALMDNVQGLIVKDNDAVSKLIEMLKDKERGRATFFPVANITRSRASGDSKYEFAIDKIKFPQEYAGIFNYLLDKVVIAKNWDEALKLYSSLSEEYKIVTRDGELLHPGGFIQGGSRNQMHALLGRKERIDKMQKEVSVLEEKLKSVEQKKIEELNKIKKIEQDLQEQRRNLANKNENRAKLENESGSIVEKLSELQKRDKFLIDEEKNLVQEKELAGEKHKETQEELEAIQTKTNKHNLAIGSIKKSVESLSEEETKTKEISEEKRIKLFNLRQSLKNAEDTLKNLEDKKKMLLERIPNLSVEAEEANKRMELLKKETEDSKAKLIENKQQIESLKQNLEELKTKRTVIGEQSKDKEQFIREKGSQLEERRNALQSLEIEKTKIETEIKDLKENISSNHAISLDDFTPPETETAKEHIKERVEDLKDKLTGMGNVNLAAIEEEEELNERYSFYLTQQKDLLDSEQSLRDTITQINSTARSLFRTTLDNVRKEFRDVFINLFQGGEADLKLVGSQDILEAGIDIVVSPPGKKLSSISLLSGGERALTSIALLFALFKVKPSPFCVLDEIDAPLDENNIERFTNFLKDLAKDTQFIIISHNKKTLSISEILYGVTMEEPGVSKMISVKFVGRHKDDADKNKTETVAKPADAKVSNKTVTQAAE
ncbi:MAG: chromosome segregation protein SMC [Candidatus Omnitrophota bacterium]